jgi:hypothetical protein
MSWSDYVKGSALPHPELNQSGPEAGKAAGTKAPKYN